MTLMHNKSTRILWDRISTRQAYDRKAFRLYLFVFRCAVNEVLAKNCINFIPAQIRSGRILIFISYNSLEISTLHFNQFLKHEIKKA